MALTYVIASAKRMGQCNSRSRGKQRCLSALYHSRCSSLRPSLKCWFGRSSAGFALLDPFSFLSAGLGAEVPVCPLECPVLGVLSAGFAAKEGSKKGRKDQNS